MKILRAQHLGMCFGVRDAIKLAEQASVHQPLTILGELVHNETVLERLRRKGIQIAQTSAQVDTKAAMITAHGASRKTIESAVRQGLSVSEATCPLVHAAHRAVGLLVSEGYHPVIVGKRDHVEVRGITEDLSEFDVVLTEADVMDLKPREKFGVAAQTTQPIERVRHLTGLLRWRFPESEVRFIDTVCQPTKKRQHAAIELASRSDVVIVIGGAHSNNTRELAKSCATICSRVFQVESPAELKPEWFTQEDVVGITAGTSTPDDVIDAVEKRLREMAGTAVALTPTREPARA